MRKLHFVGVVIRQKINFPERPRSRRRPQAGKRISDATQSEIRDGGNATSRSIGERFLRVVADPGNIPLGNPEPERIIAIRKGVVGDVPIGI